MEIESRIIKQELVRFKETTTKLHILEKFALPTMSSVCYLFFFSVEVVKILEILKPFNLIRRSFVDNQLGNILNDIRHRSNYFDDKSSD